QQGGFDLLVLGGAAFLIGADQRDFLTHVFVQEFRGLEEIVFVILLDDAKLFGIGERTEMHGGGIHGGGDVHEFQTKRAGGKREVADVADERDVGIVDRDVEVGLIVQSGGLINRMAGLFFLRSMKTICA